MHAASSPRRLRRQATELAPRRRCLAFCALACCVLPGVLVVRLVMLKASGFAGLQLDTRSILALIRAHDRPDDVLFGVRRADRGAVRAKNKTLRVSTHAVGTHLLPFL